MTATATMDISGLERFASELFGALLGSGQGGDARKFVEVESSQLAQEISRKLGPKTESSGSKPIKEDMGRYLTVKPVLGNLENKDKAKGTGDMIWIGAGPSVITGIHLGDNQTSEDGEGAAHIFRFQQKKNSAGRGNVYETIGSRGKQKVYRVNRFRVSKQAFAAALKLVSFNLGLLKASFAFTAFRLPTAKDTFPPFVSRHIASEAQGRAIFNDSSLDNPAYPVMEFGSRSIGVESNPKISDAILSAVENRKSKMNYKLKKIIAGYTYNWNTGGVFRTQEDLINADN